MSAGHCGAYDRYYSSYIPGLHTCADPLACALESLSTGEDAGWEHARAVEELLDQVCGEVAEARPSELRDALKEILAVTVDLLAFLGGPLSCRTAYVPARRWPYALQGEGGGYVRLPDRPGRAGVVYYQWVGRP